MRIQCLDGWNRDREVSAGEGWLALVRALVIHVLNCIRSYILKERRSEGCDCSWQGHWDWATAPEIEPRQLELRTGLGKSLWRRLERVCERFWSFAESCSHSSSAIGSPYWNPALGLKPDSLGENCHPGPEQNWMGRALRPVRRGAGDPSTMSRRQH